MELSAEVFLLMRKITFKKAINYLKVLFSYLFSKVTGKMYHWGMPVSIAIEPTTACNLRCPECPSGLRSFSRETGNLKSELFHQIIDQVSEYTYYLIFYFQGEPYINPNFLNMVSYASNKGIYTATSTNAHFLTDENCKKTVESGLDRIIISLDGITQEVYKQYRIEGDLQKVLDGTKRLVEWKKKLKSKTPYIIFQFLVVKPNEHQLEDAKKLTKKLGVNEIRFKTAQIYNFHNEHHLIPNNPKYARYKKDINGNYKIDNPLLNHCWRLWHSPVITWDGKMVPCCFDKDAKFQLGDLKIQTLKEVWKSEPYNNFRKSVLRSRKEIDICSNCSEGTKVWA